jgi:signal transduction histidine kinase
MRRRIRLGIRMRLLFAVAVAVAIALAIGVTAFNVLLGQRLSASATSLARAQAEVELGSLQIVEGKPVAPEVPDEGKLGIPVWVFAGKQAIEAPRTSRAIRTTVASLVGGPERSLSVDGKVLLYSLPISGRGVRVGTVVAAVSLDAYEETARSALTGSLILAALLLAAITALAWWALGRALRPVARMTTSAAAWSEFNLDHRFELGEPYDELTRLAATLDALLGRLAAGLRHEQLFTAELSHELRTPLARIATEVELALKQERTGDEYRESLKAVAQSTAQMTRTVDALVAAARQEAGLSRTTSDARDAVSRAVREIGAVAADRGVEIGLALPQGPVRVGVDVELLAQVVRPLLENAARYAARRAEVSLANSGTAAVVEVVDDGPGVGVDEQEEIFKPGVRGSAAGRDAEQGAGLGLALARRLAHSAGGEIEVRPSTTGGRFVLRVPLA